MYDDALKAMSVAADAEDKTEKNPVTPGVTKPARELYGVMLLERGAGLGARPFEKRRRDAAEAQLRRQSRCAPFTRNGAGACTVTSWDRFRCWPFLGIFRHRWRFPNRTGHVTEVFL